MKTKQEEAASVLDAELLELLADVAVKASFFISHLRSGVGRSCCSSPWAGRSRSTNP